MPARPRTSDLTFLGAGLIATVALAAISFALAPDSGPPRSSGSSFGAQPEGGKAAYLLLESLGYRIERSVEPLASLRRDPASTTIVLAEPTRGPARQDLEALRTFVDQGGHVMATGAAGAAFLPGLSVRESEGDVPDGAVQPAAFPSALTRDAPSISVSSRLEVRRATPDWLVIYGAPSGPSMLAARSGAGRLIWVAGFEPFSNAGLGTPGHAALLRNVAGIPGERVLLWDEYYHGYGRTFWSYVAATPLVWGLAQCGLMALVGLVTFGRRRGPVRSIWRAPRTSPVEFIDTMGTLYARAGAASGAVQTALTRVRRQMAARAGVPGKTPDDRLASAVALRTGGSAADMQALLARAAAAASDVSLTAAEAMRVVAALMDLEHQVVSTRPQLRPPPRAPEDSVR